MAPTFGTGLSSCCGRRGTPTPYRLDAVWYDGTSTFSCGGGAWPPDLPGQVAALSLQGRYDGVDCSLDRFSGDGTTVEISAPHHYLTGRADIPDLSRSVFLDPLPADPLPPPGW